VKKINKYINFNNIKQKIVNQSLVTILKEIKIIKHIFSDKVNENKRFKNIIHITVSINNMKNYKYILYVSMFSLLSNCNKDKTFIIYHILCTPDFDLSSIPIFLSLVKKFSHNVEMIFYNMGNNFIKYEKSFYSQATYYRLLVSLFIDADRIIHLDGDTLIFSDLNEMFNLDFHDNYSIPQFQF
jgi:lipopolysaccharide biosynthesis glycosyltransferase